MLLERGVRAGDRFDGWLPKLIHDPRFLAVAQVERKPLFEALAKRMEAEQRKHATAAKRSGRESFRELLREGEHLLAAGGSGSAGQAYADLERRFGEDERWDAVAERERERLVAQAVEQAVRSQGQEHDVARRGFRALVLETLRGEDEAPTWQAVRRRLQEDPRCGALASPSERERLYNQVVHELETSRRSRLLRARQDEVEADLVRKQRRLSEGQHIIMNLLTERVKAPHGMVWADARHVLGSHEQFRNCELPEEDQERIWEQYKRDVTKARRQVFIHILSNTPADSIGPDTGFELVLERVLDSSATKALAGLPMEELRTAWEEWREKAYAQAVEDCRTWLRSCGLLGLEASDEELEFEGLFSRLFAADVRFRRLGGRPAEQHRLVAERLQELRDLRAHGRNRIEEEDDVPNKNTTKGE